jgi:ANTAR domain
MITMTREFADRVADAAQLLEGDEFPDEALSRLTAVHNAALYRTCGRMVDDLHPGLESRAVIEQAKGIVHAELGVSPAEAFHLLSRYSQNTNQRVRKIAAGLVAGRMAAAELRPRP